MKINYSQNNTLKTLNLSKVNLFYGYSNSGKTTFAKYLEQGFFGKQKGFLVNNSSVIKDEFKVILINSKESIIDHIKLSSKSYLKNYYYNETKNYFDNHTELLDEINNKFKDLNNLLNELSTNFNNKTTLAKIRLSLGINSSEELIDNFMNVEVSENDLSSSASKELLIMLLTTLNYETENIILIIDDFDSSLDEETTRNIFKKFDEFKGTIILFTNKPNSLLYSIDKYNIFNIRENQICDFTNILFIIKDALNNNTSNHSYEEYMINYGYFEATGELKDLYNKIKINSIFNLGRIFTSKNYIITDSIDLEQTCIIPSSNEEKLFLNKVDELINLKY